MAKLLGYTVRDRVSGFQGVVTGVVEYLTGCNQALVVPKMRADGALDDGRWFDLQRVEVVGDVVPIALENGATPGPDAPPPRRI